MISIAKTYTFEAGHQLICSNFSEEQNLSAFGLCANEHGHSYTLTVEITGSIDYYNGMILNYHDLDKIVKPIVVEYLDHKWLNKSLAFVQIVRDGYTRSDYTMTAENIVEVVVKLIKRQLPKHITLVSVTISETAKTFAKWTP